LDKCTHILLDLDKCTQTDINKSVDKYNILQYKIYIYYNTICYSADKYFTASP
jgi:hypothetical protein